MPILTPALLTLSVSLAPPASNPLAILDAIPPIRLGPISLTPPVSIPLAILDAKPPTRLGPMLYTIRGLGPI